MVYINDVITGLIVFPFIAAVFTFPYVMVQYHRYGSVSKYRTLIIYSFILYMLIAYFMVILPLPDRASTVGNTLQDHLNLIPFRQIWLYWHDKTISLATITAYMKSMALWQLLFNILLTVPFGVYMHYYFNKSLKQTILFSFLLSLFYEVSQLTALFGIYPGPYRLADVEDLICNTMGGAIGFRIAYLFNKMLPSRKEIDENCRIAGKIVTGMRRFWAVLFDYVFSMILFEFLIGVILVVMPGFKDSSIYSMVYRWSFFCVFSLVQVLITKGYTLGHAICRMILVSKDGSAASAAQLMKRYFCLWLFTGFPLIIVEWLTSGQAGPVNDLVKVLLFLASRIYFVIYFIKEAVLRGERPMAHDRLSGTVYMATEITINHKLIFLDVDGTLTVPGGYKPPESALRAIKRARELGHKVFLCSGRNYGMLGPLRQYGFDGGVASCGGYVYAGDQVIYDCPLTEEQKQKVISLLSNEGVFLSIEGKDYVYSEELPEDYVRPEDKRNEYLLGMIEAVWTGHSTKLMSEYDGCPIYKVVYTCASRDQLGPAIEALGDELQFIVHDFSEPGCIFGEIINRKFDKGSAVRKAAEALGFDIADTIGFGDSRIDLEMIEAVGTSVCMEDGSDFLKERSDLICPSTEDDGIEWAFRKLGLI